MNLITMWVVFSRLWIVARLLIRVATIVLGASVLVWVVDRHRGTDAELVIHVAEPDVVLTVGDQSFTIQGLDVRPIVCEVEPGSHVLTLRRDDRVLYQETVAVDPGESRVCTAYDVERIRGLDFKATQGPLRRNRPDRKR